MKKLFALGVAFCLALPMGAAVSGTGDPRLDFWEQEIAGDPVFQKKLNDQIQLVSRAQGYNKKTMTEKERENFEKMKLWAEICPTPPANSLEFVAQMLRFSYVYEFNQIQRRKSDEISQLPKEKIKDFQKELKNTFQKALSFWRFSFVSLPKTHSACYCDTSVMNRQKLEMLGEHALLIASSKLSDLRKIRFDNSTSLTFGEVMDFWKQSKNMAELLNPDYSKFWPINLHPNFRIFIEDSILQYSYRKERRLNKSQNKNTLEWKDWLAQRNCSWV